jgi:hypothetical protein
MTNRGLLIIRMVAWFILCALLTLGLPLWRRMLKDNPFNWHIWMVFFFVASVLFLWAGFHALSRLRASKSDLG